MNDADAMSYDRFLGRWMGKWISNYGGECVAEVAQYCLEADKPIAYKNAKDWANAGELRDAFNWIQNNPIDYNQAPQRGDIVVWSGALPGSGGYGHVAIWDMRVRPGVFNSADQNWGGRNVHFQQHTYDYILGWWRPKISAPPPPPPPVVVPTPPPAPVPTPPPAPEPPKPEPTPEPPVIPTPPAPPLIPLPHPDPAPSNPVPAHDEPVPKPIPAPELKVHTVWNWLRKIVNIIRYFSKGL